MKYVFNDISFNHKVILNKGEFEAYPGLLTVICGSSGSGKTTLFKSFIDNTHYSISIMKQFPCLLNQYTIRYHIEHLSSYSSTLFEIEECIERLGLGNLLGKYPSQLSGGELTRVAFLLCIIKDKDVYLLDEPTAGLDSDYINVVKEYIDLLLELDKVVIVLTHDQLFIDNAQLLYKIENHRILQIRYASNDKIIDSSNSSIELKKIKKMYQLPRMKTLYKMISLVLSILIGFCSYAYCFDNALEDIQKNQLNQYHSTELRVGKEQGNNDLLGVGGNKILAPKEIDFMKGLKHVEDIEWRYDNALVPSVQNDITETRDQYDYNFPFSIYRGNKKIYGQDEIKGYLYTYVKDRKFNESIKEDYGGNGVYLSKNFLVANGLFNKDLKGCRIKLRLPYPLYNTSGRWKTGDSNDPLGQTVDCNIHTVSIVDVELPISGILNGESFGVMSTNADGTLYIERGIIEKYIRERNIKENRTLYVTEKGYYINDYPKDKESEIIDTYIDTVWEPTVYSVYVDDVRYINEVAQELIDAGYIVQNDYYESHGYVNATQMNQKTMMIVGTIVFVLTMICGGIVQYINRGDYNNIRDYYKQEMLTDRDIRSIINAIWIRNGIRRIVYSMIVYALLMLVVNKLLVSYTGISFISIGIIILLSFIIEFVFPYAMMRKSD